jgi:hypothetical protein
MQKESEEEGSANDPQQRRRPITFGPIDGLDWTEMEGKTIDRADRSTNKTRLIWRPDRPDDVKQAWNQKRKS